MTILMFGGRMQLDAAFIGVDSDLASDFRDADIDPLEGNGVEFRRARLFFSGTVYERLNFKAQSTSRRAKSTSRTSTWA